MVSDRSTVSVVIPARDEEQYIGECLDSLAHQNYCASQIEIIVVDNGSVDQTVEIAAQMGARVFSAENVYVGAVRNFGALKAKGDIIAFLDADCCAGPNWIKEAVKQLKNGEIGAVGGVCRSYSKANWIQRTLASTESYDVRFTKVLAGSSFVLRRKVFQRIGGFDETLFASEDDELSRRLIRDGYKLILTSECDVIHLGYPSTLLGVLKRQVWQGSSQLESADRSLAPLVIATHMYLISLGLVTYSLFFLRHQMNQVLVLISVLILLLFPVVMVIRKRRSRDNGNGIDRFSGLVHSYVIEFTSLIGRCIGLVRNYVRIIVGIVS